MDRIERLKSFFKIRERDTALIDLDGTLLDSRWAFVVQMMKASAVLGTPFEYLDKAVNENRHDHLVHPTIMPASVNSVAKRMNIGNNDPRLELALEHVGRIYTRGSLYKPFPGAIETVKELRSAGLKTILVTHGGEKYTGVKIDTNDMRSLFDLIICLDTTRQKSEQWEDEVFKKYEIMPSKSVGIGDNYPADLKVPKEFDAMVVWVGTGKGFNSEKNIITSYEHDYQIAGIGGLVDKLIEIE